MAVATEITIAPAASAGYLPAGREQIYYRLHFPAAQRTVAGVLMLGPWGSERAYAHATWTRWARALAARGFLAMRFDYRGMGESTGHGRDVSVSEMLADARACIHLLRGMTTGLPLLLHGLRFGAVIAAELFSRGEGDALLLWDPPNAPADALGDALRYRIAEDSIREEGPLPRAASVEELTAMLEAGADVICEGHPIPSRLWRDVASLEPRVGRDDDRVRSIRLVPGRGNGRARTDNQSIVIPSPPFWRPGRRLVPDLSELFNASLSWLEQAAREVRP